jgi:hypothetical protein
METMTAGRWFGTAILVVVAALVAGCSKPPPVESSPAAPPPVETAPSPQAAPEAPQDAAKPGNDSESVSAKHEHFGKPFAGGGVAVVAAPTIGSGAVDVPPTMRVGRESIARLVVSPGDLSTLLKAGGVKNPVGASSAVRLTPRMRASLIAPGSDISPADVQEQAVQVDAPTEWLWTVVPRQPGPMTLVVTLEGLITVDGKDTAIRPPAWTVPVRVEVNSLLFFENNWQWLASAILVPLAAFFGKRWLDRRAPKTRRPR